MDELPKRKNIRLKGYDYSQNGAYHITICTKDRNCVLSTVGVAAHGGPIIELTKTGTMVGKYINNINTVYQNIIVDTYVVMPDHIHMIILIGTDGERNNIGIGSPRASTPTVPQIVNSFKTITSKQFGNSLWQRNYYEEIIRNEQALNEMKQYIINNPIKWQEDCNY